MGRVYYSANRLRYKMSRASIAMMIRACFSLYKRKVFLGAIAVCAVCAPVFSQERTDETDEQMEADAMQNEDDSGLDEWEQQLYHLRQHPVALNSADRQALAQLVFLTAWQIEQLILYRSLLGDFISGYELQAVPGWDEATVRKTLPFVSVQTEPVFMKALKTRFRKGSSYLVVQSAGGLQLAEGFKPKDDSGAVYAGSAAKLQFRYRYQYRQLLQWGITLEKDPGEKLWQKGSGVDFQSFHLQLKQISGIQQLVLGDFTVNMGQGLVQWQGMSFGKGGNTMGLKKQGAVLRSYSGAGEYAFHRGAGATIRKGKFELTGYLSSRKLSATLEADADELLITSVNASGYHRTATEIAGKNKVKQYSAGTYFSFTHNRLSVGMSTVGYRLSLPVAEKKELYQRFAITGKSWSGAALDFSYIGKRAYWFGELAADQRRAPALVIGSLFIPDKKWEWSFLFRSMGKRYQAWSGKAFMEAGKPGNETGMYSGCRWMPRKGVQVDAYADFFCWPWLRYRVSAPASGADQLLKITGKHSRKMSWAFQFRNSRKYGDLPSGTESRAMPEQVRTRGARFSMEYTTEGQRQIRMRWEHSEWVGEFSGKQNGVLWLVDLRFPLRQKQLQFDLRAQYFDTDSYSVRIYAAEREVLFQQSIPSFSGRGWRFYGMGQWRLRKNIRLWLKCGQAMRSDRQEIGSGNDKIQGNSKTDGRLQLQWLFGQ